MKIWLIFLLVILPFVSAIECNSSLKNSTFSDWTDFSGCNINDLKVQFRSWIIYDENNCVPSIINYEYRNLSCDYCNPKYNIAYTNWTSCTSGISTREKQVVISKECCDLTNLSSDCLVSYFEIESRECQDDFILSPENKIYSNKKIPILISLDKVYSRIEFLDNALKKPRWITLCKNCQNYSKNYSFLEGQHDLSFRFVHNNSFETQNVKFLIDSKRPLITMPRIRGLFYSNGTIESFKYSEENLANIEFNFSHGSIIKNCSSGKNMFCSFEFDPKNYNGEIVDFNFIYNDVSGNSFISPIQKMKIDNVPPVINEILYPVEFNFINFYINVTEDNFKEILFIDKSNINPKWKVLCRSLVDGICNNKIRFSPGEHNITILVKDFAGNSAKVEI